MFESRTRNVYRHGSHCQTVNAFRGHLQQKCRPKTTGITREMSISCDSLGGIQLLFRELFVNIHPSLILHVSYKAQFCLYLTKCDYRL